MFNTEIQELLDLHQQTIDELKLQIAKIPTRNEIIKDFLRDQILTTQYSDQTKSLLLQEILECTDNVPQWLIDEIFKTPEPQVTLLASKKNEPVP